MTGHQPAERDEPRRSSLLGELGEFMLQHKAWWLIPMIGILLLFGLLLALGNSSSNPFDYPLF